MTLKKYSGELRSFFCLSVTFSHISIYLILSEPAENPLTAPPVILPSLMLYLSNPFESIYKRSTTLSAISWSDILLCVPKIASLASKVKSFSIVIKLGSAVIIKTAMSTFCITFGFSLSFCQISVTPSTINANANNMPSKIRTSLAENIFVKLPYCVKSRSLYISSTSVCEASQRYFNPNTSHQPN